MAWSIGIDLRATSGYVTDPSGCTYCLGDDYPVSRGGATFGWETSIGTNVRDRSTGVDARIAGINFSGTAATFRIDLPSAGTYKMRLAFGEPTASGPCTGTITLADNVTGFATISGTYEQKLFDAQGNLYTAAQWPASNATRSQDFTSSIFRLTVSGSNNGGRLSHVYIEQISSAATSAMLLRRRRFLMGAA